jgi:polyhydroxyalkanoate synthesis regulator phasin
MMPRKAKQESHAEQSERFRKLVQDMVDAGELNPTEAEVALEQLMRTGAKTKFPSGKN